MTDAAALAELDVVERAERLDEAAARATALGLHARASLALERACRFVDAAHAAERAGDLARAIVLAASDGAAAAAPFVDRAAEAQSLASRAALEVARRGGDGRVVGRLHELAGAPAEAAHAFERGGDARAAARLFEAAGDVPAAGRALEAAVRRTPDAWAVACDLGRLLLRFGKHEAALRALQRVPEGVPERREAVRVLVHVVAKLGLREAELDARRELERLGGGAAPASELERPGSAGAGEAAEAHAPSTRLFGRYEVVREVASSPSARVLECTDPVRGERVAVKIFAGHALRGRGRDALVRFAREVQVLRALDHPNVVPLREYVAEGPALVLAWMSQGSLADKLAAPPGGEPVRFAPARAVEIARSLLAALGEAHRLGVVHRDLKPANVLFDGAGGVRLADFGVAHLADLSTTATAGVIGTLEYMSPEQRAGRAATVRSDLYGVGALLWEMLTGAPPSRGELGPRPSALYRELSAAHDAAVLALLAEDPDARPEHAFAALERLAALVWPREAERLTPRREAPAIPEAPTSDVRLALDEGADVDAWLGRPLERRPLDPTQLRLASAFARAGHHGLQPVWRVDRASATIWLARLEPARPDTLGPADAERLHRALDALHAVGACHGAVDADHLGRGPRGRVVLAVPRTLVPTASVDLDRLALARLFAQPGPASTRPASTSSTMGTTSSRGTPFRS